MFGANTVAPSNHSMEIDHVNTSSTLIGRNVDSVTVGAPMYGEGAIKWNVMGVAVLIAGTTCGNLLVCIAVCRERSLHNMANYFLMSLAIADLLVSVFVMPVGMAVLLFGYFPLPPIMCVIWATLDVLMCTASIWHMCTMSVDRYLTLKYPMRYGRNRTKTTMAFKVTAVWVISIAICLPLGVMGLNDYSTVYVNATCTPSAKQFVLYGSIMAFYVPLLIMLVTYWLTVRILHRNHRLMEMIAQGSVRQRATKQKSLADGDQCQGFNEPTAVDTNDKKIVRPSTLWVTRLSTHSSIETTSVSYMNASSSATQEPCSSRCGHTTPLLAPGTQNEADGTLLVNNPRHQSSAGSTELQQIGRSKSVISRRFQSRDHDFIRSTSSCSQLQQQRRRVHRKLMSSLSDQRQKPLLAVNSQPNLQHVKAMKTRGGGGAAAASAGMSSRPISSSDRRQYSSTKSCVASARDLESVMNYMSLSIPLSLNDVSRRPSVVFGDGKYPDMLDRLSQIEAEMDECLTPDAVDNNASRVTSVKIIMSSVSENRLTSSSTSMEFDGRDPRLHSCSDLSRQPTEQCKIIGNLFKISGDDLMASPNHQNDVVSNRASSWTDFTGRHGCSDCCCDDNTPELVPLIGNGTVKERVNDSVTGLQVNIDHQPAESYSILGERRSSLTRSCEYETPVKYIMPSCPQRKSSMALILQRTRSSQSLGPWTSLAVDGLFTRASTEYEVNKFATPVVNILSQSSSPDDERRRCFKSVKSPNRRVTKYGIRSANSSTGDIARQWPDESQLGVVQRDTMSTLRQCMASSASPERYEYESRLLLSPYDATRLSPSLGVNRHNGNPLGTSTEVSPICASCVDVRDAKVIRSPTGGTRQQRLKTARRRNLAMTSRLCSCCWNRGPRLRSDLITLRRVSTSDSSCGEINLSKRASRKERKATKVLGIILMAFVLFWTPFFAVNLVTVVYPSLIDDWLTDEIAASIVWWGYTASLANPVIYTLFSESFRSAFCRVLTCQPRQRTSLNRQPRKPCAGLTPIGGNSHNQLHSLCRSRLNSGSIVNERPSSVVTQR